MDIFAAKDVTKLVKTAVRIMVNEVKAERAMVVLPDKKSQYPQPAGQFGFDVPDIWNDDSVNKKVLEELERKPRTVFVLNAQSDRQFESSQANPCTICIPLTGNGFIYCDHSQPGGLDHTAKDLVEKLGSDFRERFQQLKALPPPEKPPPDAPDAGQLRNSACTVALLVFLMIATVITAIVLS